MNSRHFLNQCRYFVLISLYHIVKMKQRLFVSFAMVSLESVYSRGPGIDPIVNRSSESRCLIFMANSCY
jgi:hypothetical protein